MPNIAAFAPIPRPRVATTAMVKPGFVRRPRTAYLRSWRRVSKLMARWTQVERNKLTFGLVTDWRADQPARRIRLTVHLLTACTFRSRASSFSCTSLTQPMLQRFMRLRHHRRSPDAEPRRSPAHQQIDPMSLASSHIATIAGIAGIVVALSAASTTAAQSRSASHGVADSYSRARALVDSAVIAHG